MENTYWVMLFMGPNYHHWYVNGSRVTKISNRIRKTRGGTYFHCQDKQGFTRRSMGTWRSRRNYCRCACSEGTRGGLMEGASISENQSFPAFDYRDTCANVLATYRWKLLFLLRNYHFQVCWTYRWVRNFNHSGYSEFLLYYPRCYGCRQHRSS